LGTHHPLENEWGVPKKAGAMEKDITRSKIEKSESSANSIGEKLRSARKEKGVSLEEANRITKIHLNILKALEEDKLEGVFGKTYTKIFLKDYADYLGLDVKEIIEQYTSETTSLVSKKPILEHKPVLQKKEKKDKKFSHAIVITLVFIVWFFILGFTVVRFIQHYKYVRKNKDITVSQKLKGQDIVAQKTELKKEEVTEKKETLPATEVKKEITPIPQGNIITLTLISDKDVWLKITEDAKLVFHGILPKNSKETWQATKEIRLSEIGKPEALKLNINGKDIDLTGKRLSKNILITHKGIEFE